MLDKVAVLALEAGEAVTYHRVLVREPLGNEVALAGTQAGSGHCRNPGRVRALAGTGRNQGRGR